METQKEHDQLQEFQVNGSVDIPRKKREIFFLLLSVPVKGIKNFSSNSKFEGNIKNNSNR